jgi:hypothetical protein
MHLPLAGIYDVGNTIERSDFKPGDHSGFAAWARGQMGKGQDPEGAIRSQSKARIHLLERRLRNTTENPIVESLRLLPGRQSICSEKRFVFRQEMTFLRVTLVTACVAFRR